MRCGGKKGGMKMGGKVKKDTMPAEKPMMGMKKGGKVKMRGTGCAKRGIYSRGPMA
jgi:general stress protein YciG